MSLVGQRACIRTKERRDGSSMTLHGQIVDQSAYGITVWVEHDHDPLAPSMRFYLTWDIITMIVAAPDTEAGRSIIQSEFNHQLAGW